MLEEKVDFLVVIFFFGETSTKNQKSRWIFQGFSLQITHRKNPPKAQIVLLVVRNESFDEQLKYSLLRLKLGSVLTWFMASVLCWPNILGVLWDVSYWKLAWKRQRSTQVKKLVVRKQAWRIFWGVLWKLKIFIIAYSICGLFGSLISFYRQFLGLQTRIVIPLHHYAAPTSQKCFKK